MEIKEIVRLTRFEHAVMLALAVFIGETILLRSIPPVDMLLALSLLVPVLSEMGSFALNDYLDVETDRLNRKMDRPLVRGAISLAFARNLSIACLALSVLLAYFINMNAFLIALLFNVFAVAYNAKLKDLPLLGNIYIALTMAIPFIFGNFVVANDLAPLAVILAALGFVAGLAREIVKTVQDMEGDMQARGSRTLPVVIGKGPSLAVAVILYLLFIPLSASPFVLGLKWSVPAGILVTIGDLMILSIIFRLSIRSEDQFAYARKISLIAFFIGMIGLLLAAI